MCVAFKVAELSQAGWAVGTHMLSPDSTWYQGATFPGLHRSPPPGCETQDPPAQRLVCHCLALPGYCVLWFQTQGHQQGHRMALHGTLASLGREHDGSW